MVAPTLESAVCTIVADLLSDEPTYQHDLQQAGIYSKQLTAIRRVRQGERGLHRAKTMVGDLKQENPEFAKMFAEAEEPKVTYVPPLPEDMTVTEQDLDDLLKTVSPWLHAYVKYSTDFSPEAHPLFHIACGLWVLAVAAARRIQVPLADPVITPLALVMVARSTLFAKTTTAKAALKLLRAAGLGFLLGADETTPQKLLHKMAGHLPLNFADLPPESKAAIERRIAFAGQVGWYYDEFNQLLNAMTRPGPMAEFAGLLRKMDNCPDTYSYETKSGEDYIENPYLPLLASTTPANLAKHAAKGAEFWNDGLLARMLFVCPERHSFITQTMEEGIVEPSESLVDALSRWHEALGVPQRRITEEVDADGKGKGKFTPEIVKPLTITNVRPSKQVLAGFNRYRVTLRTIIKDLSSSDLDGSYGRLPTMALRIAALLASLEHGNHISTEVWTLAQAITEIFRKNLHELYAQVAASPEENPIEDALISYLQTLKGKEITVREILQFGPTSIRRMKSAGVRDLLLSLEKSGITKCRKDGRKECFSLVQAS